MREILYSVLSSTMCDMIIIRDECEGRYVLSVKLAVFPSLGVLLLCFWFFRFLRFSLWFFSGCTKGVVLKKGLAVLRVNSEYNMIFCLALWEWKLNKISKICKCLFFRDNYLTVIRVRKYQVNWNNLHEWISLKKDLFIYRSLIIYKRIRINYKKKTKLIIKLPSNSFQLSRFFLRKNKEKLYFSGELRNNGTFRIGS